MSADESPWAIHVKQLEEGWFASAKQGVADTYVYRYYDDAGALLYVGQTGDPARRDAAHKSKAAWFPLVATRELRGPMTKTWALMEEFVALGLEEPIYNQQTRNGHAGPCSERWDVAMSDEFRKQMLADTDLYRAEMAWCAKRMSEFFVEAGLSFLVGHTH